MPFIFVVACLLLSDMSNEEATFPCLLSPKHSHSTVLLKNRSVFENSVRKCVSQRCGFMVSDRTLGPIILVETYSVPNLTSCNGTSRVSMGFVADQYLLFYEFFLFTELEPVFTAEPNECWACFAIIHTKEVPVHKISLAS